MSYWVWSISGDVGSVKTAVEGLLSTSIVNPTNFVPGTESVASSETCKRVSDIVECPTKNDDNACKLRLQRRIFNHFAGLFPYQGGRAPRSVEGFRQLCATVAVPRTVSP